MSTPAAKQAKYGAFTSAQSSKRRMTATPVAVTPAAQRLAKNGAQKRNFSLCSPAFV
jgi:hypothetical protein